MLYVVLGRNIRLREGCSGLGEMGAADTEAAGHMHIKIGPDQCEKGIYSGTNKPAAMTILPLFLGICNVKINRKYI